MHYLDWAMGTVILVAFLIIIGHFTLIFFEKKVFFILKRVLDENIREATNIGTVFGIPVAGESEQGDIAFSSYIPPGALPVKSILEDIRSRCEGLKVKVFPDQRRVQFSGNLSQVTAAKRDLDSSLSDFMTMVLQVNEAYRQPGGLGEEVSVVGKMVFTRLQNIHHLVQAKAIKDEGKLTVSGREYTIYLRLKLLRMKEN